MIVCCVVIVVLCYRDVASANGAHHAASPSQPSNTQLDAAASSSSTQTQTQTCSSKKKKGKSKNSASNAATQTPAAAAAAATPSTCACHGSGGLAEGLAVSGCTVASETGALQATDHQLELCCSGGCRLAFHLPCWKVRSLLSRTLSHMQGYP